MTNVETTGRTMNPAEVWAKLRKASLELREASEDVDSESWQNALDHWDEGLKIVEKLRPRMEYLRRSRGDRRQE